jgi:carbonic anhydrase
MEASMTDVTRRHFCRLAALGGGAALFGAFPVGSDAASTDALLLSCMDYRLTEATERYMAGRSMRGKYDHVILAGASLGAITDKFPDWGKTFFEHLDVAIQLHQIHRVIVLDHRDCGAYKTILGQDLAANRARETDVHAVQLRALRTEIKKRHSDLDVELLLMALDGKVETVA